MECIITGVGWFQYWLQSNVRRWDVLNLLLVGVNFKPVLWIFWSLNIIFSQNNGLTSEKSTFNIIEDRCAFSYSLEILVFYTKTSPIIILLLFKPKTKLLKFFYFLAEIMGLNPSRKNPLERRSVNSRDHGSKILGWQQRELKQRERQKGDRFRLAKQQLCRCIKLFCTFLSRCCTTATWNLLISRARFME